MAAVGDDCYFFCTSICAKGPACPFRHVEAAKTCKIICQHWQTAGCFRPMCKFRHSDFHIPLNHSEIPCYWETQPVGCSKANCLYKHSKPRPNSKTTTPQSDAASSPKKESENVEKKESADVFVMPTVKPVIIDPESEASNSSPVKNPPKLVVEEESESTAASIKRSPEKKAPTLKAEKEKSKDEKNVEEGKAKKIVPKKKKKPVLTQKNGKAAGAGVKKVKKEIAPTGVKSPVKRKKVEDSREKKPVVPVKKKVKDRLGVKPVIAVKKTKEESEDEEENSDSDDSIENLKVLSVEEIFRQKALESMMKKRAAEGKPMMPEYSNNKNRKTASQPPKPKTPPLRPKKPVRKPPTPPPESESEEESEEEEEEEESEEEVVEEEAEGGIQDEAEEEEDSEDSSSSSESSSPDSSESEEESEVRRVVINLDAEKNARKRAKASLLKRSTRDIPTPTAAKIAKRKVIRDNTQISSISKHTQRISAKERLGKPKPVPVSDSLARKGEVRSVSSKLVVKDSSEESGEVSDENSDDGNLGTIKIKSLEEIKQEKMKSSIDQTGRSPVRERLGPAPAREPEIVKDEMEGRRILVTEELSPKLKKRPWSSGQQKSSVVELEDERTDSSPIKMKKRSWSAAPLKTSVVQASVEEDQRTVSAVLPVESDIVSKPHIEPESPFESLRQRIFLRKTQLLKEQNEPEKFEEEDETEELEETRESGSGKRKKHKHKHKSRKKSKKERQIYVPPAMKSSVGPDDLTEQTKIVPSPPSLLAIDTGLEDFPDHLDEDVKPASSRRPKHKAAALWAAGLSLPAKGLGGRPRLKAGLVAEKEESRPPVINRVTPTITTSKVSSSLSSASTKESGAVPVVKTFSEIMAEKRQKRLQARGANDMTGAGDVGLERLNNSSSPSKLVAKSVEDSRPRVPITPIRFEKREEPTQRTKIVKHASSAGLSSKPAFSISSSSSSLSSSSSSISEATFTKISSNNIHTTSPSVAKSSTSMSDIRPTYKTARAKKLFKKTKSSSPISDSVQPSDSSVHISSKETESGGRSLHLSMGDNSAGDTTTKSPTEGRKSRRPSAASESHPKQSTSLDDEFNFLDGGDLVDIGDIEGKELEPIDDLLQDIDDLLA